MINGMMTRITFIMVLQLAHAVCEGTTQPHDPSPNITGGSPLASSPFLTGDHHTMSQVAHPSEKHMLSLQKLIKTLQWNHTIVLYNHAYSKGDEDQQFLLLVLGLTSVYDLGDLHNRVEVKQVLHQLHDKFFPRLNFLLLSNYDKALQLLQIVDQCDLESNRTTEFRHHSFWMVVCNSPCQPETGVLSQIHHLENVVLIVTQKDGRSGLHQLIMTSGGRSFSPMTELNGIKERDIFPNRRYGLNKRKLIVSTMVGEPYVMKKGNHFEGYLIEVLDSIASALNFSYEIVHPSDMQWGVIVDGRWNGLVGQLERREVDLVVSALSFHEDREKVMDFLHPPVYVMVDDILYNLEAEEMEWWQIYLKPFRFTILIALSVTLVTATVMGYILRRCDEFFDGQERIIYTRKPQMFILADTFSYMFGILMNRGSEYNPRIQSARLLLFTWGVFSVIIAACYTAKLVAFFAAQKPSLPFTSLGELVRHKEYKWGFIPGHIREHIFNRSRSGDMKLAWEGVVQFNKTDPDVLSRDFAVHTAKLKMEKYAMITVRYRIQKMKSSDCSLQQVGQNVISYQLGLGVPTDFPLKKDLEDVLSAVVDSGLPGIWWKRWSKIKAGQCIEDRSVNTHNISDVASTFFLLCVGFGTAGVVLVTEVIYNSHYRQNKHVYHPKLVHTGDIACVR